MLIELISTKVTALNSVDVTYTLLSTSEEFKVTWERDSYQERFELAPRVIYSEVEELDELICEAINTGETVDTDCSLYLEIRDTFDYWECENLGDQFQLEATADHEFDSDEGLTIETVEGTLFLQLPTTPDSQHSINGQQVPGCNVEQIIKDIYEMFNDETKARLSFALNTDIKSYAKYYDEDLEEYRFKATDWWGVTTILKESGGSDYTVYEVCDGRL